MNAKPLTTPKSKPAGVQTVRKVKGARATGVREELEQMEAAGAWNLWLRDLLHDSPSWLTSMVVHMVILLALALLTLPAQIPRAGVLIAAGPAEDELEPLDDPGFELPGAISFGDPLATVAVLAAAEEQLADYAPEDVATEVKVKPGEDSMTCGLPFGDPLAPVGPPRGPRTLVDRRKRHPRPNSPEAKALSAALKWLAEHQLPDGSWSFDHILCARCRGQCRNPGRLAKARIGATGLALLPFLGAAQTHKTGKYRTTVSRGLYFLVNQMKISPKGGSLHEEGGRMYSHGIASIVLCEAYALTHDRGLHAPAQQSLNFICYAQDPVGGGWRYEPRQPGDTSVVGWQIMALKSGHMAYLQVPPVTTRMAVGYFDGVQSESGAKYGYTDSGRGSSATTAIGLLCRMYLGWKKDNPALQRGVQWLSEQGPAKGDMYYNYYATQVMRHWDGELWRKWDAAIKNQLVASQTTAGHEAGSWYFKHTHADSGGRLYCTAMAAMTLEVEYRDLPLYDRQSVEEDFPE